MRVTTSKTKNAESFYITRSYINEKGVSTSEVIRKLGTLASLMEELGTDRDGVMAWAKEQAAIETRKYKEEREARTVLVPFHADRQMDYDVRKFYAGGYLFLQSVYYQLRLDKVCLRIKRKYRFKYDLNAILSDLVYTRVLSPGSKRSSYRDASCYLEAPGYGLHDVYRALSVLAKESDFIQSEAYKNSGFVYRRNDHVLYYDCTNYYFELEQESGDRRYGKSKEHRPNPIIQMGMFVDGDGIPLAFTLFPGNQNEQLSLKPLETRILQDFGCTKFIYCSDAGLGSEKNREFNNVGERAFIVTQSIRKLNAEDRKWALDRSGFKRLRDGRPVNIDELGEDDLDELFYKDEPYTPKRIHQRLIVTYSPKFAAYQRSVREAQIERARSMVEKGKLRKQRRNPNDPARFVGTIAVTRDGESADIKYYLDEEKIAGEEAYDGLYAVCTDLLDDDVEGILRVSEGRWQIEACFRTLKTEFEARPVYVSREDRIQAHFLTCFLSLMVYRLLEKKLGNRYTCGELLKKLKEMNFADIEGHGFMPLYKRDKITDSLHDACGFRTDWQFITREKMRTIQKNSKGRR
ncbi:MAG: IS1634 family transposase [bacterium]